MLPLSFQESHHCNEWWFLSELSIFQCELGQVLWSCKSFLDWKVSLKSKHLAPRSYLHSLGSGLVRKNCDELHLVVSFNPHHRPLPCRDTFLCRQQLQQDQKWEWCRKGSPRAVCRVEGRTVSSAHNLLPIHFLLVHGALSIFPNRRVSARTVHHCPYFRRRCHRSQQKY